MESQKISSSSVADIGSKSIEKDRPLKGAKSVDEQKNEPFKEQFTKQVEQAKDNAKAKKTSNNQEAEVGKSEKVQTDGPADEALSTDGNYQVAAEESSSDTSPDTSGDMSLTLQGESTQSTVELPPGLASIEDQADMNLPEQGNILPLADAGVPGMQTAPIVSQSNTTKSVSELEADINVAKQKGVLLSQREISQGAIKSVDTKPVNLESDGTLNKPFNAVQNPPLQTLEKLNIQDARYAKAASDMPAADAILKSSRLQQVPVTTSVSSNTLAPQSMVNDFNNVLVNNGGGATLGSSIPANIQTPNWSQQMTQQVSYMVKGGFQQAEIKLNPENLGPMEIKLSIKDDKASLTFVTQHVQVRDAIDTSMPRLKEMLEQQGINLLDVDVSTQSDQQQAQAEQDGENSSASLVDSREDVSAEEAGVVQRRVTIDKSSGVSIFA